MPTTPNGIASLELGVGQKNKKGATMQTNRLRVEGEVSGTLYLKSIDAQKYEVLLRPIKDKN